jgi:nucleotide-binding universal stress UspA family protein
MAEISDPDRLAYSIIHLHPLRNIVARLEGAKHLQNQARTNRIALNREYQPKLTKTRLYISHFIQVLNLAIHREEIPENARGFYGLEDSGNRVPEMKTDREVLDWGKKIIEGENQRIKTGGVPVMMPNISRVRVWYDQFRDGYYAQVTAVKSTRRADDQVAEVRKEVDTLLATVWDEVEAHFRNLPEEEMREQCREYGIVYVKRKGES